MQETNYRTTAQDKKGNLQKELSGRFPVTTESGYFLSRYKTVSDAIKEWIHKPYDLGDIEEGVGGPFLGPSSMRTAL